MEDEEGAQWSRPVQLTRGLSITTINTGVDVSRGRVTKAFEIIPQMAARPHSSDIVKDAVVAIRMSAGASLDCALSTAQLLPARMC